MDLIVYTEKDCMNGDAALVGIKESLTEADFMVRKREAFDSAP